MDAAVHVHSYHKGGKKKDLNIKANSKVLKPFGGHSGWTFHIKKDAQGDRYRVKLKKEKLRRSESFCS